VSLPVTAAMRVGRAIHRPIRAALRLARVPSPVVTTRGGITFELDLDEAIDVGLYLLGIFEPDVTRGHARDGRRENGRCEEHGRSDREPP